jgi:hypothetical protein
MLGDPHELEADMHVMSDVGKMVGELIRTGVEFGEDVATRGRDHIRAFEHGVVDAPASLNVTQR